MVYFNPNLKDRVFVTLHAPDVIINNLQYLAKVIIGFNEYLL